MAPVVGASRRGTSWCSAFRCGAFWCGARYGLWLVRVVATAPPAIVATLALAVCFLVPAVVPVSTSAASFTREYYQGILDSAYAATSLGAASPGAPAGAMPGAAMPEGEFALVEAAAQSSDSSTLLENAAAYKRYLASQAALGAQGSYGDSDAAGYGVSYGAPGGESALSLSAGARLAELLAERDRPEVYAVTSDEPAAYLLASLATALLPYFVWLTPCCAVSLFVVWAASGSRLLATAPVSSRAMFLAAWAVAAALSTALVVIAVAPSLAVATVRNGWGDLGYPVVYVSGGAVAQTDVGTVAGGFCALLALSSVALSAAIVAIGLVANSFYVAVAATALLLAAPLALDVEAVRDALGACIPYIPTSYFLFDATLGAPSYSGMADLSVADGMSLRLGLQVLVAFALAVAMMTLAAAHRPFGALRFKRTVRAGGAAEDCPSGESAPGEGPRGEDALVVENLTLAVGLAREKELVREVSFAVRPGEVCGLVAPNGYGKTTLMRAMGCAMPRKAVGDIRIGTPRDTTAALPYRGRHFASSGPVSSDGGERLGGGGRGRRGPIGRAWRRGRGREAGRPVDICVTRGEDYRARVFYADGGAAALYPWLTVRAHLALVCGLWPYASAADEAVAALGIEGFADKRSGSLSQGMRQLAFLACAYGSGAKFLLLDEPMNALDPVNVRRCSELVRSLGRRGTGVLLSSHILENLGDVCDRVLFIVDRSVSELVLGNPTSGGQIPGGQASGGWASAASRDLRCVYHELYGEFAGFGSRGE